MFSFLHFKLHLVTHVGINLALSKRKLKGFNLSSTISRSIILESIKSMKHSNFVLCYDKYS